MNVQEVLTQTRDVFTARRVIGDPYEKNGVTVIPVVAISGGGGAGMGEGPDKQGSGGGGGFGLGARPVGAYVVDGEGVRWLPAVDMSRVILGAQLVAAAFLLTLRSLARARARRAKFEARA